jgi:predicted nucleic acid-binding protein
VECLRTLERHRWSSAVPSDVVAERRASVLALIQGFDLASVSSAVLERAGDPFPTQVATLDAIHLATALIIREEVPELAFATHDQKLARAARSMGFAVTGV